MKEADSITMTTRQLSDLFATLNQHFFHDRLPKYRIRFGRRLFQDRSGIWKGRCDDRSRVIKLHESLAVSGNSELRRVFLHEICHIRTPGGHGKRWQKKMLRLAELGEAWAAEEVTSCVQALKDPRSFTIQVKDRFEELTW